MYQPVDALAGSVLEIRKRQREDDADTSSEELNRIKLQYIYQALFKEHKNYDNSVMALGKVWRLHKVYLCQSPYFASMFSGSWYETDQNILNIDIVDPKVNLDASQSFS